MPIMVVNKKMLVHVYEYLLGIFDTNGTFSDLHRLL